jgi:hypothetical protein
LVRWWFEQIGFWGEPGTAAPGENSPAPLRPYTFPSENSLAEYKLKYPRGFNTSFTHQNSAEYSILANQNDILYRRMNHAYAGLIISGLGGLFIGIVLTTMYHRHNQRKFGYMPL